MVSRRARLRSLPLLARTGPAATYPNWSPGVRVPEPQLHRERHQRRHTVADGALVTRVKPATSYLLLQALTVSSRTFDLLSTRGRFAGSSCRPGSWRCRGCFRKIAFTLTTRSLESRNAGRSLGATNFFSTVIELLQHRQDAANRCVAQSCSNAYVRLSRARPAPTSFCSTKKSHH
jgi:hypothetical protein